MSSTAAVPENRKAGIVVVVDSFPVVSETFVVDHVLGLARRGHRVTVVAMSADAKAKQRIEESSGLSFDLVSLPELPRPHRWRRAAWLLRTAGFGRLAALRSRWERDLLARGQILSRHLHRLAPDLIHAHFGPNAVVAAVAARGTGIPCIADFHGYDVTIIPGRYGWGPYRRWLAHATAVVHSSFVRRLIAEHLPCRVERVHLGVDTDLFVAPARADRWPQRIGFLFVGRLMYQKGAHVALGMMAIFKRHYPEYEAHLTLCGDGPDLDFFRQCARAFGIEEHVTFTGAASQGEVASRMREADVLLIPSVPVANGWEEAFCRVAVEGMAMKMAVIGSRTGGLEETIGTGGHTFRAGSAMSLFGEVKKILDGSGPGREGERAGDRARQFTIGGMDDEYAAIVDQSMSV